MCKLLSNLLEAVLNHRETVQVFSASSAKDEGQQIDNIVNTDSSSTATLIKRLQQATPKFATSKACSWNVLLPSIFSEFLSVWCELLETLFPMSPFWSCLSRPQICGTKGTASPSGTCTSASLFGGRRSRRNKWTTSGSQWRLRSMWIFCLNCPRRSFVVVCSISKTFSISHQIE